MAKFIITADSACDGSLKELESKDISIIFFKYSDGKNIYVDTMEDDKCIEFYQSMKNGTHFTTSQINPQEYYVFFKPLISKKLPIIHLSLSSGLSNTINNVYIAANMLKEDDETCDIYVIDSLLASAGLLLLIDKLVEYRDNNLEVEEALEKINYYVKHLNTFYTTNTLKYFARGGRLSKVEAFIGNALKINPVLDCSPSGKLRVVEKVRGSNRALEQMILRVKSQVENPQDQTLILCHADDEPRTVELAKKLVEEVGFKGYKIYMMGSIIGAHAGPGVISVYFFGKEREETVKSLHH